ncbi:MAG: hypothetical protein JOZ27_06670, partial [Caulobacteraceae bacterium]|nr:hypothetical protein [Caulobacteraceae bacterium]
GPTVVSSGEIRDLQYVQIPGVETPVIFEDHAPIEGAMAPRQKYPRYAGAGTSYAAPRVSVVLAWLRVVLNILIADVRAMSGAAPWTDAVGLAIPIVGLCDTGIDPVAYAAYQPSGVGRMAHDERQRAWYGKVTGALFHEHGINSRLDSGSAGLKRALLAIARPMPDCAPHEVGAGFVSLSELEAAIRNFTPRHWVAIFVGDEDRARLTPAMLDAMDAECGPLWTGDAAEALASHIYGTPGALFVRVV